MTRFYASTLTLLLSLSALSAHAQLINYGPWSGAVTSHSVQIAAGLMQDRITSIEVATLRDFPRFQTFAQDQRMEGAPANLARFSLYGLESDTTYYYRLRVGNIKEYERIGTFRTFPLEGEPASFRFAIAADALSQSSSSVYSEIRFQKPRFFLHLGNFHHAALKENSIETYFETYRQAFTSANQSELYAAIPLVYTWDRLDFGGSADRLSSSAPAAHAAYRHYLPHYPLSPEPDADIYAPPTPPSIEVGPINQAFSYGRVRFIILDSRTARDPVEIPDGPEKSMLGAPQLEWLKRELLHSGPTHPLIFIATSTAWHGTDAAGSDDWARYDHERTQIASWIKANNITGLCFLSGNGGSLASNDGSTVTGKYEGNFPEFHVGPIDRRQTRFGGNWTQDVIVPKGIDEFFGLVDVEDNVTSIKVTFTGLNQYAQEQLRSSFTLDVPRP